MIYPFIDVSPHFDDSNFIAPTADIIGDVTLGAGASVWFNATIRGDVNWIRIGASSNVQDNAVVHVSKGTAPTTIGVGVTIGHGAVVHGCTVADNVLIGMGAIVMDHAEIGAGSIVGAGALVTAGTTVPPGSLVLGRPAKVVRALRDEEVAGIAVYAQNYLRYSAIYRGVETPGKSPFYEPESNKLPDVAGF